MIGSSLEVELPKAYAMTVLLPEFYRNYVPSIDELGNISPFWLDSCGCPLCVVAIWDIVHGTDWF